MIVTLAQQRPIPPEFSRPTKGRFTTPLELEPQQAVPQPFRRVSLPLYRGRGFSLDGQEPKPVPQVLQQQTFQPKPAPIENNSEFSRVGNSNQDSTTDILQPTRLQGPPLLQQAERSQQQQAERVQQQQVDRVQQQQQQIDRVQQQPEKQFPSFRPQVFKYFSDYQG